MIPDYNDLHAMHEAEQEWQLRRYPKCSDCKNHITDDFLYEINGKLFCETCHNDTFRRHTEDFMQYD